MTKNKKSMTKHLLNDEQVLESEGKKFARRKNKDTIVYQPSEREKTEYNISQEKKVTTKPSLIQLTLW